MPNYNDLISGINIDYLTARVPLLESQRQEVLTRLDEGNHAYGFNTLFGPLDTQQPNQSDFQLLIDSHSLGKPTRVNDRLSTLITTVKALQLAQGGSGISPDAYLTIVNHIGKPLHIDLRASYGSGDVVPGTAFLTSVFGKNATYRTGDIMSIINGNYISTAYLAYLVERLEGLKDSIIGVEYVEVDFKPFTPPQLPVSLRDMSVYHKHLNNTLQRAKQVVTDNLSTFSGNPIFTDSGYSVSQSSFLNLQATDALLGMLESTKLLAGLVQRRAEQLYQDTKDTPDNIQLPKVIEGYRQQINQPYVIDYFGSQSDGVEDLWDNSLSLCLRLDDSLNLLNRIHRMQVAGGLAGIV